MTRYAGLEVSHAFDAAHRLPQLPGKCRSLHGHTWHVTAEVSGPVRDDDTVVDMSDVKAVLQQFVDIELDHGTMLGAGDPLVDVLRAEGTKVFTFDGEQGWNWPTVEAVAATIWERMRADLAPLGVKVARVRVAETDRNAAVYP